MPVYKDEKNGSWYAMVRFEDWKDQRRQKCKQGFATKREAQEWERTFQQQNTGDLDMTFEAFCELYEKDMRPRLKENTWNTKEHIIRTKLLPYFGKRRICEIETKDVIAWQNELLAYRDGKKQPYSATYLKIVHNQLTAILAHAVKHYGLKSNPASRVGCIGSKESEEMQFWPKEEYLKFAEAVMDKPMSYYAFEMLYWCGIREGELLALTPGDFDFKKGTVSISKSYQRLHGEDVITSPKTRKSIRTIKIPEFLSDEMCDYIQSLYGMKKQDRIFPITKSYLYHEMERGAKAAGVKRIRIHDLRYPYVKPMTKNIFCFLFTVCLYRQRMMGIGHTQEDLHLPFLHIVHISLVCFRSHNNSTYLQSERFHRWIRQTSHTAHKGSRQRIALRPCFHRKARPIFPDKDSKTQ